ncbi:MAG: hypothetical protein AABX29_05450 [Nanoarchaeota archaeon]
MIQIDFKPLRVPKWNDPGKEVLSRNSELFELEKLAEQSERVIYSQNSIADTLVEKLITPKTYCGKSGAEVKDTLPRFTKNPSTGNNEIEKSKQEKELEELEYKLYCGFKEAGLPVPNARLGSNLNVEYAGIPLDSFITNFYRYNPLEADEVVWPLIVSAIKLIPRFNLETERILNQKDKQFLNELYIKKLAEKFNLDKKTIDKNFHLFRILEAIPGADSDAVPIYEPLAEELDKALDKFGSWGVDIYPKNIGVNEDYELSVFDFNRPRYNPVQVQLSRLIDFFIPLYEPFNPVPVESSIFGKPYDESTFQYKKHMINLYLEEDKSIKNKSEFLQCLQPCRAYFNIRWANLVLEGYSNASNYPELLSNMHELRHHFDLVNDALLRISGENRPEFKDVSHHYAQTMGKIFANIIPGHVLVDMKRWVQDSKKHTYSILLS